MKRKLLVLLTSFALLLLAFWAYRLATQMDLGSRPRVTNRSGERPRGDVNNDQGLDLHVEMRDNEGRLQAVYDWPEWEKISENSYRVEKPRVVLYQKDGKRVHIWGDNGTVEAERVAHGYNIRRGTLRSERFGGVKIFFDLSTDPNRKPPLERTEPEMRQTLMRFLTDRIDFDNQRLVIHTDSRIQMLSRRADIDGRGLDITWNEAPRELTRLRIDEGQQMKLYEVSERDNPFSLSPSPATRPASRPATAPAAATGPAQPPTSAPAPAPRPATKPVHATARSASRPASERKNVYRAEFFNDVSVESAGRSLNGADKLTMEFEWAGQEEDLTGGPRPPRPMGQKGSGPAGKAPGKVAGTPAPAATPSTQPQTQPDPAGWHGRGLLPATVGAPGVPPDTAANDAAVPPRASDIVRPVEEPGASQPATRPASRPATRPADTTVTIRWKGPMVLTPIGHVENPSRGDYVVFGEGGRVVLKDVQNTAVCRRFFFERCTADPKTARVEKMKGQLLGKPDDPARLLLGEGQEIVCEDIRFDRLAGQAWLTGPGTMTQPAQEGGASTRPAGPRNLDLISWTQNVHAFFGQELLPPGHKGRPREFVQSATFQGQVKLVQSLPVLALASTPASAPASLPATIPAHLDFVECDHLDVTMDRSPAGRVYPKLAIAQGNAHARQETTDIRADELRVVFDQAPPSKADQARTRPSSSAPARPRSSVSVSSGRARPVSLTAKGHAFVIDNRDDQPIRASADLIVSDPIRRTAELTGPDVRIAQGPNVMTGTRIQLEEGAQVARVIGPGSLDFLSDKDLNGAKLPRARPLRIVWDQSMDYAGTRNSALFAGNVKLRSDLDKLDCQKMQVIFEKAEPTTRPSRSATRASASQPTHLPALALAAATRPAPAGRDRARVRPVVGIAEYSKRRVSMILADDQVVLQSRREDDQHRLLRRVQLACQKLAYNAVAAQVDVVGGGTMLAEDYRPPAKKAPTSAPSASEPLAGNVESPAQTAFQWTKSMVYMQDQRSVSLEGQVLMVHRSGDKVVLADQVNRPAWPSKLPVGRRSQITCDRLLARFDEPPKPATRPAASGPATRRAGTAPASRSADDLDLGPRLGPLRLFHATGDVNMQDGNRQILAQRLVYDRSKELDLAIIWGYLPGQPQADAHVYEEDVEKGTSRAWNSPQIIWDRKSDSITVQKASGSGR